MPTVFDNIETPFLDGEDSNGLKHALKLAFRGDFCVGYFNLRGWRCIDDVVNEWPMPEEYGSPSPARLLVGMQRMPHDQLRNWLSDDPEILRLDRIIEKGFFIESHKSLLLQLCDLCTYSIRKNEEAKLGRPMSGPMQTIAALADPLIHRGNEAMPDILAWLQGQYQSGAARGIATGTKKGSNHTSR